MPCILCAGRVEIHSSCTHLPYRYFNQVHGNFSQRIERISNSRLIPLNSSPSWGQRGRGALPRFLARPMEWKRCRTRREWRNVTTSGKKAVRRVVTSMCAFFFAEFELNAQIFFLLAVISSFSWPALQQCSGGLHRLFCVRFSSLC